MAFHRRKLLDPSLLCKPYCDAPTEYKGYCPSECFDFCPPDTCTELINQTPPPPLPPPPASTTDNILNKSTPLSLLLIASLAVLATAFFIFTCYTIYKFYAVWLNSRRQRPPQPSRPDDGEDGDSGEDYGPAVDHPIWYIRTAGLQPSVINAIAVVKYKKSDGLVDGADCAVCLSEFQEDETVRLLPKCNHAFHIPCIDTWLASHTNCPMCRAGIVSAALSPPAGNSGRAEEAQPEGSAESRIEIEDQNNYKMDAVQTVQSVRRSVSMDSISASMISAAVANALSKSKKQLEKGKESDVGRRSVGVNRPSIEMAGSSSIKRSASCSAKLFLSRHISRNSR